MKKSITILLQMFLTVAVYAQQTNSNAADTSLHNGKPLFIIDSTLRTTNLPLFNPDKIESIWVQSGYDSITNTYGKIYITSKKNQQLHFLSLQQIAQQQLASTANCLFMVDNELVKNLDDISIDADYILRCEKTSTKDIAYLSTMPALTILHIKTKSAANMEKANSIRIRGANTAYSYQ